MKKLVSVIICLFIVTQIFSQVFNTAGTLKKGKFSIGLNPAYYNDNLGLFLHGNAGIVSGVDTDLLFNNDIDLLLWLPFGIDLKIRKKMSFLFEAEIPVTDPAFPIIDGGIMFYF